jgi:hypothetical protein
MSAVKTATELCTFPRRSAGSDAERRAAGWLAHELRHHGREATIETFWSRPNWALAHAWHAVLGLAASVVMVSHARIGGALAVVAMISVAVDAATGRSLGRRLTPERASQNVVSRGAGAADTRVIVTANYDAGRTGLVHRPGLRSVAAAMRGLAGGGRLTPGWLGWLEIGLLWLVVVAIARNAGSSGAVIDVLQIVPSVGLLAAAVALLELGLSPPSPAAGDNAAGVAVALAAVAALDRRATPAMPVDLVLQGASDGEASGLRRYLRGLGSARRPAIVLGIAAAGHGAPRWWRSDGSLWPLGYDRRLGDLAAEACGSPVGHRGRGVTPALTARAAGLRAITLGCLDDRGLVPRSHRPTDVPAAVIPETVDAAAAAVIALVAAIERAYL